MLVTVTVFVLVVLVLLESSAYWLMERTNMYLHNRSRDCRDPGTCRWHLEIRTAERGGWGTKLLENIVRIIVSPAIDASRFWQCGSKDAGGGYEQKLEDEHRVDILKECESNRWLTT